MFLPDDSIATSRFEKCLAFDNLFQNNLSLKDSNAPPPNLPPSYTRPPPIISTRRVHRVLSKLDVAKAYGSDGIPSCVQRECASELSPVISRLFRHIVKTDFLQNPGSIRWCSPSLSVEIVQIHQITALFLSRVPYLKYLKLFLMIIS